MKKIGKYDVIRLLGSGATSSVYLARDPFAQRDVAIKVAAPEILKHPDRGSMYTHLFLNEASLVGRLSHPHIEQIYDAVVAEDLCYIVMEHVQGGTLEECCDENRLLPVERVVEIAFKCSRALAYAQRLGVTHRDIKPANILYVGNTPCSGDIKISDFGAALVDTPDRTQVSGVGSPAYMSPEQLRETKLDHRTDIYSLGVMMYQLLTGHLPFQASNNYNIVYQIINSQPTPPSRLRKDIPASIDAIVARAMHKDADARYPTWEEFSHDLAQAFRQEKAEVVRRGLSESERFDTLRRLPFFGDFSDVELWEVLRFSTWNTVAQDEMIMRDGDSGDFFCFVIDGELKVTKNNRLLNLLSTGDCFGEMAVISRSMRTRNANIAALTEAKIVTVHGDALRQASAACRMNFYQAFLEVMVSRLTLADARLAAL